MFSGRYINEKAYCRENIILKEAFESLKSLIAPAGPAEQTQHLATIMTVDIKQNSKIVPFRDLRTSERFVNSVNRVLSIIPPLYCDKYDFPCFRIFKKKARL